MESGNQNECKGTGHMAQTQVQAQTTVEGIEGVQGLVGRHMGYSNWVTITQEQVNQFAVATNDHQWIHVHPERAEAESPFGGPIAHGYLTLSLVPGLLPEIVDMQGFRMGVNYGTEKVRFPSPVPVGSRVRAGATLASATPFDGGITVNIDVVMEIEGVSKPAMVATVVYRRYL
ncbi:Acyl dehydratase [Trujillonella endophytica]|uniref:Acyl dehydratase n=2 Tax=Trujillonella endophytica TaxID=673521 RepID=A0A1H8WRI2_9ACTN|nr:Acyl dehydratase [Trujillella endophytica]